jgi:hypothetical protein
MKLAAVYRIHAPAAEAAGEYKPVEIKVFETT